MRDPRVGLYGISGGVGILAGLFLGTIGGHWSAIPVPIMLISVLLLLTMRGGMLRTPVAIIQAVVLGLLTLPLLLNGTGVITLIGCLAAVAGLFYRPPDDGAPMPGWLEQRRVHGRRRRRPAADDAGPGAAAEPPQPANTP